MNNEDDTMYQQLIQSINMISNETLLKLTNEFVDEIVYELEKEKINKEYHREY